MSSGPVSWSSSEQSILSVTSSGLIRVVQNGAATITATADGKQIKS
ncbi:MAG: Ig-like domain-containing protein [Saprospiraceae bacterium]|nr:Ig-like domain-containing protein [Saprospiraceae bacterium]